MTITRRLSRIFQADGKALIVAMDHGLMDGPCKGLEDPGKTISQIVAGGADAVLTSYGVCRRFAKELGRIGLIMRTDGGPTAMGDMSAGPSAIFFGVEQAIQVGADAMAISAFPGFVHEAESLGRLAEIVSEAHAWGIAVLGEMVPGGFDSGPEFKTVDNVALSARVGVELGADIIKTPYAPGFEKVTSQVYAPVVILGGAKRGKERDMLVDIKAALDAGASGVAIGRNIWQADNPRAMTAAVASILHGGASVDEAVAILEKG